MAREVFSRPKHPVGRKLHTDYSRSDHGDELAPTPQAVLSIAARSRVSLIFVRPLHSRVLCHLLEASERRFSEDDPFLNAFGNRVRRQVRNGEALILLARFRCHRGCAKIQQ